MAIDDKHTEQNEMVTRTHKKHTVKVGKKGTKSKTHKGRKNVRILIEFANSVRVVRSRTRTPYSSRRRRRPNTT